MELSNRSGGGHIISLGFFCGPSQELERCGYRSISLPFDWLITEDFRIVLDFIKNHFVEFLDIHNLVQEEVNPKYYYDTKYKIHFYHDFSSERDLASQIKSVKEKYERRIRRFYMTINSYDCLLIRYCYNEEEVRFILNNMPLIDDLFASYNRGNRMVYVVNDDLYSVIPIDKQDRFYPVPKDGEDTVSRHILLKNEGLKILVDSWAGKYTLTRLKNLYRYNSKQIIKRLGIK